MVLMRTLVTYICFKEPGDKQRVKQTCVSFQSVIALFTPISKTITG